MRDLQGFFATFLSVPCGERGIRTPGTVARTPHFECGPIDHSGISPICSDSFSPLTFRPPRFPFTPTRLPQG